MWIALLLVSDALAARSAWPAYLSGIPLVPMGAGTITIGTTTIAYDFRVQDDVLMFPLEESKLHTRAADSYRAARQVAARSGLPAEDCKPDLDVHFVELLLPTLNSPAFQSWRDVNGGYLSTIHGLYDPTVDVPRQSVILYASRLTVETQEIVVHELGHYWFDRWCLYDKGSMKTEAFAKQVEQAWWWLE
jgi:hypothetical protein